MTIAIRYFTKSKKGNTKKLADAVSAALGIEAQDVSVDLAEKADRLFLINAMYAANIDPEVKAFYEALEGDMEGQDATPFQIPELMPWETAEANPSAGWTSRR